MRILDGSKNIEAEQRERKMTMAARQQSISRSQAAMVERKRMAERRRIEQYEGSEIGCRSVGSDGATPETARAVPREAQPALGGQTRRRGDDGSGVEGPSKRGGGRGRRGEGTLG